MVDNFIETEEDGIIKAASFMPRKEEYSRLSKQILNNPYIDPTAVDTDLVTQGVLLKLFGDVPDYEDERMEALWQKTFRMEEEEVFEYCFSKGIDVFDSNGVPVPPWRDIAVMLRALELGFFE